MHPADLELSKDKLACFLWLARRPATVPERYGSASLPVHMHLAIGPAERDAWLLCMRRAIEKQHYRDDFKTYLYQQLDYSGAPGNQPDCETLCPLKYLYIPHGGGPIPLMPESSQGKLTLFLQGGPIATTRCHCGIECSLGGDRSMLPPRHRLILYFDYYGFPPETYEYQYPCPGQPALAEKLFASICRIKASKQHSTMNEVLITVCLCH